MNPCVAVAPMSWSLGDEIYYFDAVKTQETNRCSLTITVQL